MQPRSQHAYRTNMPIRKQMRTPSVAFHSPRHTFVLSDFGFCSRPPDRASSFRIGSQPQIFRNMARSRADQASSFRIGMQLSNLLEHGSRLPVFCERMTATALACIDGTGSLCSCAHGVARTAAFPPLTPRECNCLGQGSLPGAAPASEAAMKMLVLVLCPEGFVKPAEAATADKVGGVVFFVESAGYNRKRVQLLFGVLFFSREHSKSRP